MKQNEFKIDWIAFFRISISLYAILNIVSFWKDIPKFLYEGAYIKPELLNGITDNYTPTIYDIYNELSKHIVIEFDSLVSIIIYLHIGALFLLSLGFFTRTSALISFITQIIIFKSMHFYMYGADFFLSMTLFYCIIFPKSKFSIDYLIFKFKQNLISLKWSLRLLQAHICIIYFFSGLDKGLGINWYNGESIWRAVSAHNYNGLIDLPSLDIPNYVYISAGIMTLIVEFFYPLFINLKLTRNIWLYLTIMMHLSIAVFMGLYLFAMIMIIINLAAYYFPYLEPLDKKTNYPALEKLKSFIRPGLTT